MPDIVINEGTQTTPSTPEGVGAELAAISQAYGPKRVKTPNMEVEQFDPIAIQRAEDRANAVHPTLGSMNISIAVPSCVYQYPRKTR